MKATLEIDMPKSCYACWFKIGSCQGIRCIAFKYLDEKYSSCGTRKSRIIPKEYDFPPVIRPSNRPDFCPLKPVDDTNAVVETAPMPQINLRDYFAAAALSGFCMNREEYKNLTLTDRASDAYLMADAMLQVRNGEDK